MVTKTKQAITVSLRVNNLDAWSAFRKLAAAQHMSANGLLNAVMEKEVARAKRASKKGSEDTASE